MKFFFAPPLTRLALLSAFAAVGIAAFALAFSACQSLRDMVRDPAISIHSVELTNITFNGVELLCRVNVENPNAFDIPFPEIGWELFVNSNSFIQGVVKNDNLIKSRKTTVIDVPLSVSYAGLYGTFQSLKNTRDAAYRIAIGAKFAIPVLGDRVFNFEHSGSLPLLQMPKISSPSFKIAKLDFTGADILCSVNIENPNVFPLPFPDLNYDYSVNKNSLVKSSVDHAGPLAAGAVSPVNIRLRVVYADLYRAFQSLRNSGEAPCLLALSTVFPVPAFGNEKSLTEIPGTLPLLKAPSLSFKGISVKNISLAKLDFEVNWEIENDNNFDLNLKNLSYDLRVNNSRWGEGKVPGAPVIAAHKTTVIPLAVSLNALSVIGELTDIISRGADAAYICGGNLSLSGGLPGLEDFNAPFNFSGNTKLKR
jgi:LEA14-like dessication related protein